MVPTANHDPFDHSPGDADPRLGEYTAAVLDRLRGHSTPVTLSELAADVADHEATLRDQVNEATDSDHHRVQIRLHHVDLPVLSDAEHLEYDDVARLVSPRADRERVRPTLDMAFELLAHRHRRTLLECLDGRRWVRIDDLATRIAQEDPAAPPGEPLTLAIDRVRQALHHRHLPKLQQAEVVVFNQESGLVMATEHACWLHAVWRCADRFSERFQRRPR